MFRKIVAVWVSLAMLFGFIVIVDIITDLTPSVKATTLYVNETGSGGAYTSIQDAINDSKDGDTVFVYNGTYIENVVVNRSIDLTGEDRNTTIINGSGSGDVIKIIADYVNVSGLTVTGGKNGFEILSSSNNITDNNISNNEDGLRLFSSNNNISGNNVYSNIQDGIYLSASSNNITDNNVYSNNEHGIQLTSSSNNNIRGNNVLSNNRQGIYLWYSLNINITNNNLTDDGVVIMGTSIQHFNSHTIPDNNIVNSKPLYYKKDCSNISIDCILIGQLILVNCTNVSVTNLQITNTDIGIKVVYSTNISLENNTISSNNHYGIHLASSSNNTILYNNISNNGDNVSFPIGIGIKLSGSSNNNIKNNTISSNGFYGIYFYKSLNNNITNNTISLNNGRGIEVGLYSNNNSITNNDISSNKWGIYLSSSNINLTNNNVSSNINGGVYLWSSSNNNLTNNNISSNTKGGIYLWSSSNSKITNNNVYSNGNYGIKLESSSNNRIYHNNIIDNTNQAYDDRNDNSWDNGYPPGGNYWSDFDESTEGAYDDYNGQDQNVVESDGIVDNGTIGGGGKNPYIIDADSQDNYPLIYPIGNYIFLHEGWNLISIPFIQLDTNLSSVLNSITGSYKAVQWYNATDPNDHWKHNSISKPSELNDLDSINHKMGFWIYVTEPGGVLFQYFGIQPTENQTIALHPGWNLVGYPSLTSYNRTEGLNNLTFNDHVDAIWSYDASVQKWEEMGESDYFQIGKGYYIHNKSECEWEVPL